MLKGTGRKRRFLGYGALNVLVTNLVLQLLLLVAGTGMATLLSQLVNVSLGFVLYGKKVFRVEKLRKRSGISYLSMAMLLWWANWAGITQLGQFGIPKNLSALCLIPVLAFISYFLQKKIVFARLQQARYLKASAFFGQDSPAKPSMRQ